MESVPGTRLSGVYAHLRMPQCLGANLGLLVVETRSHRGSGRKRKIDELSVPLTSQTQVNPCTSVPTGHGSLDSARSRNGPEFGPGPGVV